MAVSLFKWIGICLILWLPTYNGLEMNVRHNSVHPLYVTVSEFNYNSKDRIIEISCKIFTNDFEAVLEKTFHTKVDLSLPSDKKTADKLVNAYVQKHLQLKVDGKPVQIEFVGSEKETDATWSYFQVSHIMGAPQKLEITNSLLYDSFDGQINIMHVSVSGNRKSQKLDKPDSYVVFQF
ncbi:MAG: hypothetical protein JST58_00735 [Bacteroidetes bacterium]|nr:hypothetical protein [Bacteroidota bacterium]